MIQLIKEQPTAFAVHFMITNLSSSQSLQALTTNAKSQLQSFGYTVTNIQGILDQQHLSLAIALKSDRQALLFLQSRQSIVIAGQDRLPTQAMLFKKYLKTKGIYKSRMPPPPIETAAENNQFKIIYIFGIPNCKQSIQQICGRLDIKNISFSQSPYGQFIQLQLSKKLVNKLLRQGITIYGQPLIILQNKQQFQQEIHKRQLIFRIKQTIKQMEVMSAAMQVGSLAFLMAFDQTRDRYFAIYTQPVSPEQSYLYKAVRPAQNYPLPRPITSKTLMSVKQSLTSIQSQA